MGVVMGVMMVLMVAAFIGYGHHGGMTGSHGKESQKEEVIVKEQAKEPACTDCPAETGPEKADDNLKPEEIRDGQSHD